MLAARLVCYVPRTVSVIKLSSCRGLQIKNNECVGALRVRWFASQPKSAFQRVARKRTLKEIAMGPATDSAFNIGKGALAGASAFGLGALCYYGLGLSNEVGAIDKAVMWPQYVRERIKTTYLYFGGSIAMTAAAALSAARSPMMINLMMRNSFMAIAGTLALVIGSGVLVQSMPYTEGFGTKQLAWMAHSGLLGAVIAPICLLGGPLLVQAAWYTASIVGGLSLVAACAPSEKFLNMGGPLAIGFGAVFAASIGSMFMSPGTALGAGLYSISMYGGLIIFSGLLLYDTQRIIKMAEHWPVYHGQPYDPINASISIYLDTLNIFVRIAQLLAGGGSRRK